LDIQVGHSAKGGLSSCSDIYIVASKVKLFDRAQLLIGLRSLNCMQQMLRGKFTTAEPEFALLHEMVKAGDCVIDVGANVGHYTMRLSDLVGPTGHVLALEPIAETYAVLVRNARRFQFRDNVTLLNVAASDSNTFVRMSIPTRADGGQNYYEAAITNAADSGLSALAVTLDSLLQPRRVALIKIDAEEHEAAVVRGALQTIRRDLPHLIIEGMPTAYEHELVALGYAPALITPSPNVVYRSPRRD
jgi:FkbM family methyltransferase